MSTLKTIHLVTCPPLTKAGGLTKTGRIRLGEFLKSTHSACHYDAYFYGSPIGMETVCEAFITRFKDFKKSRIELNELSDQSPLRTVIECGRVLDKKINTFEKAFKKATSRQNGPRILKQETKGQGFSALLKMFTKFEKGVAMAIIDKDLLSFMIFTIGRRNEYIDFPPLSIVGIELTDDCRIIFEDTHDW